MPDPDMIAFATKVERLCDFIILKFIDETTTDDSPDFKVLYDLKEEAADIVTGHTNIKPLRGLAEAIGSP